MRKKENEMTRLIQRIGSGSPSYEDASALASYGIACIEPLIRMTSTTTGGDTAMARASIFRLLGVSAIPSLLRLLRDSDPHVRIAVIDGLATIDYTGYESYRNNVINVLQATLRAESNEFAHSVINASIGYLTRHI